MGDKTEPTLQEQLEEIRLQKKQYFPFKEAPNIKGLSTLYYYDADLIEQFLDNIPTLIEKAERKARYEKVNRFEVIDNTGRAYVKGSIYGSPVKVELSLQDDNRTLKVFVKELKEKDK